MKSIFESIQDNLKEASYSRIYQHTQDDSTFAIIGSQDQVTGEDRSTELNNLVRDLTYKKGQRIGFNKVDGTYTYQTDKGEEKQIAYEKSLIIYNISKEEALQIGNAINQESIVWKDKDFFGIIYCKDGSTMMTFDNAEGKNMNFSNAEEMGFGTKLKKDDKSKYGFTFEGTITYPKGKDQVTETEHFIFYKED